ncbi:MAG: C_GCAxxG_C_C family protein [Clostridiales bacterium]|jgi:C_GCAxxG_C_C family probable redox protein|nr:C_GCAxxG_C_C family protein [Clostridiales bacterium]
MTHKEKAREYFMRGYNCSQSVFAAFCDATGVPEEQALRLSSSFGGGLGRLREVCGAVSGMAMVAGELWGYSSPEDKLAKKEHYALIQSLASEFKEQNGSIICRELLKTAADSSPEPTPRTQDFYKTRPCLRYVESAADILDATIEKKDAE